MATKFLDDTGLAYFWGKIKSYIANLLSSKADDSAVVHVAGTETVSGLKTFTNKLLISGDHNSSGSGLILTGGRQGFAVAIQTDRVIKGTAPSVTAYSDIEFYGTAMTKYQERLAVIENKVSTNNLNSIFLKAYNLTSAENTDACTISCNVDASGNAYTAAPTPAVADNSTKIATTAWVRTATGDTALNAATASAVAWSGITNKPTTVSGYGITDAKIDSGTITIGSNSITPLTSHQSLDGKMTRGSYERIQGTSNAHKDLNNYKTAGFYNIKTDYVDNCPTGIDIDAVLLVYPWDRGNYCTQEITESAASGDTRRWIRKLNSSTWSAWKQVAFTNTTLAGYGIIDAKIANGTITLGSNSITPLTSVPSHNQASDTINAMTGYSKPSSGSAITVSDSLNDAIGKLEAKIDSIDDTNYVHIAGDENITGTKTFVGSKKIAFKQSTANDKLGFTLYNNSDKEQGYLEYNPTNKVSNVPLFTLGNYATAANELTYVGFRRYSNISGASGAYNLLAPLISDAKTPFNLTTTYTNFYLPLGISDGTNIVKASNSGVININSLLTLTGYTKPSSGSALATTDTIKQALGKLEAKVDTAVANSDGIPVGSIVWLSTSTIPTGFLLCNGQAVGRTTYSDLFTAIGTTYGSGDGSTTFNLPNLIDKFIEGTNNNVGTSVAAGLPNITGEFRAGTAGYYVPIRNTSGAFTGTANASFNTANSSGGSVTDYSMANFNASNSNSIYGNSATVQPSALKLLPCIKAYNSVSNISELDVAQLENELQNNYVHLTGDETINGIKEFTDNIHISKIHPNIHISNQALVKGTNPDQVRWNEFLFCDNSKNYTSPYRFGMMGAYVNTEGTTRVMMFAYKWIAGSSDYSGISVFYPKDGTPYTEAPTPESSSDNSSKIATTAWVNSASSVVHTSGNEVINGAKIFTSDITIQYTVNAILQGYTGCLFRTVDKNENPTGHIWIDAPESPTSSGYFQLVLYNNIGSNTSTNGIVQLTRDGDGQWVFCTTSDRTNTYNLGSPGRKWKTVYAGTGSINTSDIRLKDNITSIPDEILDTWENVSYCQFKFKDAIKEKGVERSRYHTGVIAQNLDELFKAKNLDISKYGLFCYDEWDAGFEPNGPDPENKVYYDSDYIYSIRYEEALCMEAAYQRRKNKILENRISELERQVSDMLVLLQNLTNGNG